MSSTSVWAVITSFRPDPGLIDALEALRPQVDEIVIVDDGSGAEAAEVLDAAATHGATVVQLAQNSGIATAVNTGIRAALDGGADAVVTFDQDSVVTEGFVSVLLATNETARARGRLPGPIVPEYFADVRQVHRADADGTLVARHSIQSGMLLPRDLIEAVGLMRAELFIDLVDTEFELRCLEAGREAIVAPGLRLAHSLGRQYECRLFGRVVRLPGIPPVVTLSTPFRYYYRVRNRLVVNGLYGRRHLGWVARDTILELIHYANAWLLARPRRALWSVYRAALRDARRGRMGRIPDDVAARAATVTWAARPVD